MKNRNELSVRNTLTVGAVTNRINYRVSATKRIKTLGNNTEGSGWNNDGF